MNRNSRPHSGPVIERQFAEAEESRIYSKNPSFMQQGEIEEESESMECRFLWGGERQGGEKQNTEKSRRGKKKARFVVVLPVIVLFLALAWLFEWLKGVADWGGSFWTSVILACIPVMPEIIKMLKAPGSSRARKDGESLSEGIVECVKDFVYRFSKASGQQIRFLIMAEIVISFLFAQCAPFAHARVFWLGGMAALANYDNNNINHVNNNETDKDMLADGSQDRVVVSQSMKQYLAGSDDGLIELLDKTEVGFEQKNLVLKLSDEDLYDIFLRWGNVTKGYVTQEQLNGNVQSGLQEWLGMRLDNVFNREPGQGGAPQDVKNSISQASDSESPGDSFTEIADRLELREGIFSRYPKRSLKQLIANDCQKLALMLAWHEGMQSTVIYYYGQSILSDFECLKFADNTDESIKRRLAVIAQRFEDIAYVCPDFEWAEQARCLAEAFRNAADQY